MYHVLIENFDMPNSLDAAGIYDWLLGTQIDPDSAEKLGIEPKEG